MTRTQIILFKIDFVSIQKELYQQLIINIHVMCESHEQKLYLEVTIHIQYPSIITS